MPKKLTDRQIEELYQSGEFRLSQERNDFFLPQILDYVRNKKWLNLRPEYQRRLVWDKKKRSRFIESLLMNVPIPPVFLYEWELNRYEVMDGQQRLNTIVDFCENRFKLSGLEKWTCLHGKCWADLPPTIQSGLERRRISATILMAESAKTEEVKMQIRRSVFERLNTGGLTLTSQELRNSLYSGKFNDLIVKLAQNSLFADIWEIPRYEDNVRGDHISQLIADNRLYKRMSDCEIVLRFFAFRKEDKIKGAVRDILDNCMEENKDISDLEIHNLREIFITRLKLAYKLFGPDTFRITEKKENKLSQPLYDAIMVAIDRLYNERDVLIRHSTKIKSSLKSKLEEESFHALIVGRANTAVAIKTRLNEVEKLMRQCIKRA